MTVEVVTFGCRLNAYESEALKGRAGEAQLRDTLVINTCAVTREAVRQSRQAIRRAKRENPARRIIITGCAAQIEPQSYAAMPEVDAVFGNREKLSAQAYAEFNRPDFGVSAAEKIRVNDIMSLRENTPQMVDHFDGKTRAFLEVQNGCDHRCTFCVIPYGRGNSRSVPLGAVVGEARRLVEKGFSEIVLTGVDLTSYGGDLPGTPSLGTLVEKLLALVPDIKRLRLSSIDAIEADPVLMRAVAEEERLMPHFHLSAQSGDDLILKRMKRRHNRQDVVRFCDEVRRLRPGAAFGADLIAGFPTESEAAFENSLALVDDAGLSHLHVFAFSPRPGTPAARMPQLPGTIIKQRAARLRQKGEVALTARLDTMTGSRHRVLMERGGIGRTPCFTPVKIGDIAHGSFLDVRITGRSAGHLTGIPV
ncbi:MAG: tRNA (N(6)-L-threonylcarbamoyladenosine(37)-C(2))-methylthiotransferase MtaB [Rhizomicrobium sp.]